jgi:hypothetical protein
MLEYSDRLLIGHCQWKSHLLKLRLNKSTVKKSNFHSITGHESTDRVERYRSTLSLTSAQNESASLRPRPADLLPGVNRYVQYTRLFVPQDRSGWVRKISPTPGFDLRIVQPVATSYTD